MNSRTTWEEMRAGRADSSQRRRGYDRAGRAIRLAFEIRTLREKKGQSQRQLAELVGTSIGHGLPPGLAHLEGGRISPSVPTLDRIAAALDRGHRHHHRHRRTGDIGRTRTTPNQRSLLLAARLESVASSGRRLGSDASR